MDKGGNIIGKGGDIQQKARDLKTLEASMFEIYV
jgi:hypothetical protein